MFHKILVAVDRSPMSQVIWQEAVNLAKSLTAKLLFFHALSPLDVGYPRSPYPNPDVDPSLFDETMKANAEELQHFEHQGVEFLQALAEQAQAAGVMAEFSQYPGDPGKTICQLAERLQVDLILLGRRGRSGLSEWLLGSVSNYVLHHAPCSVLTVQGLLTDNEALQQYLDTF
jgi:nucleotide-binding universal stress UspA family protein